MYYSHHFVIDWDRVQTLGDMKRLLNALDITFEPNCVGLSQIEDLVRLEPKTTSMISLS